MGFSDELYAEAGESADTSRTPTADASRPGKGATGKGERKGWFVLEGSVGSNGKPVGRVGDAQLKVLRAARQEVRVDAFLSAISAGVSLVC